MNTITEISICCEEMISKLEREEKFSRGSNNVKGKSRHVPKFVKCKKLRLHAIADMELQARESVDEVKSQIHLAVLHSAADRELQLQMAAGDEDDLDENNDDNYVETEAEREEQRERQQAREKFDMNLMMNFLDKHIATMLKNKYINTGSDGHWLPKRGEALDIISDFTESCFFAYKYYAGMDDIVHWSMLVYKLFTKRSVGQDLMQFINKLFAPDEVQGLADISAPTTFGDVLRGLRSGFDMGQEMFEHPVLKKFKKLYYHLLTQGFLARFGLKLDDENYSKLEQRAIAAGNLSRHGLWLSAFDVILFLLEKSYEFKQTGDICVFAQTTSAYDDWYKRADKVLALAPFTGNLEAHGTTHFEFLRELDSVMTEGEAYVKYTKLRAGTSSHYLTKKMASLYLVKAQNTTIEFAQRERKAPLGVLLHGKSSVAKSTFAKMLFYYYGKIRNLPTADHYIYRRSPASDYWTNFDTSMWCIELDDIAFLNPKKSTEVDPTLKELLNVINNTPYMPNQASLEDKGKTPVRADLVICTTNTLNINADEYFSCPLAVQRRLPFVISITPKDDYRRPDGMFKSEAADVKEGMYPDYWKITVSKIQPYETLEKVEKARIVPHCKYENILDFLADFGKVIMDHEANQQRAMSCDNFMSDIAVCDQCFRPKYACNCVQVQVEDQVVVYDPNRVNTVDWVVQKSWKSWLYWAAKPVWYPVCWSWCRTAPIRTWCAYWTLTCWLTRPVIDLTMKSFYGRSMLYWVYLILSSDYKGRITACLNSYNISPQKIRTALFYMMQVVQMIGMMYFLYDNVSGKKAARKAATQRDEAIAKTIYKDIDDLTEHQTVCHKRKQKCKCQFDEEDVQGNRYGSTEEQLAKEEEANVWYNSEQELTTFDVPLPSQSMVGVGETQFRDIVANNIVCVVVENDEEIGHRTRRSCGVYLTGHDLLVNAHSFAESEQWTVTIYRTNPDQGISDKITFLVRPSDLVLRRGNDLALLRVWNAPPARDIYKFWSFEDIHVTQLWEFVRRQDGSVLSREMFGVMRSPEMEVPSLGISVDAVVGTLRTCDEATVNGDCGGLGVAATPRGPVIVGIHLLGRERTSGVMIVKKSLLDDMLLEMDSKDLVPMKVQGGGSPSFSAHGITRMLGPLHHRSMTRYMPKGTLRVYGSFVGFRPNFKSSVCKTPLCEKMCEHFNYEVDHGKPAMMGFEPFKNNLEKMVGSECPFRMDVVREISQDFFNDIIQGLPEGWESELVELSDRAAVNGLPGVKYIDAINRSTSMGFPWNKSKKGFLFTAADERYPDGVDFDSEFWERVREIERKYARGERAYPIFSASLKDTPTPFKKIAMKKTRVFTGGPADFSIVSRKVLLPFVRLLQKNRFLFEAAPGVVTQSCEWGEIYKYLTPFGEDRMVAGDYGSYDKKMKAMWILYAFMLIAAVYKAAGFDDQYVTKIMCIGEDTAFSFANFNGDLYEFFGSNPSGHTLTVIINSIVNSLYMRYCYWILNPKNETKTFKEFVHLMTYGDDNIMGVSRKAEWFNHTAIQRTLETIGVEYTMADKTSDSVPFINIANTSFLKRKWRWDEEIGAWMAPLELDSIKRALTVTLPSKTIDKYTKMVQTCMSELNEFFFYGREIFDRERSFFLEVLADEPYCAILATIKVPTYDQLVERFHSVSEALRRQT